MRPDRRGEAWTPASALACTAFAALLLASGPARADGWGFDSPTLTVTETAIATQRFAPRGNETLEDSKWGAWIDRLDAALQAGRWTAGLRLDSAVFWARPDSDPTRFQDAVYPAKLWVTYAAPGLEITLGDAYVQFGRGLTLSMRKVDELGIDTTVRGVKLEFQRDPFAVTAVAGFANPARIDEASGRSLFLEAETPSFPVFGSDRVVGAEIQAGRGLPVTLSTRAVRFSRCAPFAFDANAAPITDFGKNPGGVAFGSCNARDVSIWIKNGLPSAPPDINANDITMAGQSIEVPNLAGHGKLYLEAATQYRHSDFAGPNTNDAGNALYGAFSFDAGPVTSTLEIKSNRNFYPVAAAIDLTHAPEFNAVAYSFVPPAESPTILDTEFGYFNACVNGGRLRTDVRASDSLLVYGQGIFADSKSENTNGGCDARGRVVSSVPAAGIEDIVWDGVTGLEWSFNHDLSHVFASGGVREDHQGTGDPFYRERHVEYSIVKYLKGPFSIEVQGFHRLRWEQRQNLYASDASSNLVSHWWHEGENYVALKIAPAWVFSQGFEYTTQGGYPAFYANGSILYKFGRGSNLRLFAGQQRAAFRCASGICRFFPAFEGARAELTLRF
jgi:hypothetical protein